MLKQAMVNVNNVKATLDLHNVNHAKTQAMHNVTGRPENFGNKGTYGQRDTRDENAPRKPFGNKGFKRVLIFKVKI